MHGFSPVRPLLSTALALGALFWASSAGQADVLLLHSGGHVCGEWINPHESAPAVYVIQTPHGRLSLEGALVFGVIRQPRDQDAADRLAWQESESADDQWLLARWRGAQGRQEERLGHLQRLLELDPDHLEARKALGYVMLRGRWVQPDDWRRAQGYERYRGRWRLSQEILLNEEQSKRRQAETEWAGRLKRWREAVRREGAAPLFERLAAIDDPLAVLALREALAVEPWRPLRLAYVEALGRIADAPAVATLVEAALDHADEEVRYAAIGQLAPHATPPVIKRLIKTLQDNDNRRVRCAATALGRLGDDSAVEPLIDALITTHRRVLGEGASGARTVAFTEDGTSLVRGRQAAVFVERQVNQEALEALIRLTREPGFGFDQQAWRRWRASARHAAEFHSPGGN